MGQIEYYQGIFQRFISNPNLEAWYDDDFPEMMWGLGFEMDCFESFNDYISKSPLREKKPSFKYNENRYALYYLEHADKQIVGNYVFSYWRYLTHWSTSGYTENDALFLNRVIAILDHKYSGFSKAASIDEFAKSIGIKKMNFLGEDEHSRYYIKDMSIYGDIEVGLPTVIEEYMETNEFIVLDTDTAREVRNRF